MFQRSSEYRRDEDKGDGGWRSWFGMGGDKKDRDDRDQYYSRTMTYRDGDTDRQWRGGYGGDRYTTGGDYGRGGYGYQTSGEYAQRGGDYGRQLGGDYGRQYGGDYGRQGFSSDRDIRGFGQTTGSGGVYGGGYGGYGVGDRDYYRSETRTYGGDRDIGSRAYGAQYGGDRDVGYGGRHGQHGGGMSGVYGQSGKHVYSPLGCDPDSCRVGYGQQTGYGMSRNW